MGNLFTKCNDNKEQYGNKIIDNVIVLDTLIYKKYDAISLDYKTDKECSCANGVRVPTCRCIATECIICYEEFKNEQIIGYFQGCKHIFHEKCIKQWAERSTTCPICRGQFI